MGFFDLDSSWYKTNDVFLRKGSLLIDYMINEIDNNTIYNQAIKRFSRYMTANPLAFKWRDNNGMEIFQKDLKDSLMNETKEGYFDDNMKTKANKVLFNESFDSEMQLLEQCYIFVYNYRNKPISDSDGEIYIKVDIIVPNKYDSVLDFESGIYIKRGNALCMLIDSLFNHRIINNEKYSKFIGNLKFELLDNQISRIAKTSDGIVYSLTYGIKTIRGEIYNGNI